MRPFLEVVALTWLAIACGVLLAGTLVVFVMLAHLLWTNWPVAAVLGGLVATLGMTGWSVTYLNGIN